MGNQWQGSRAKKNGCYQRSVELKGKRSSRISSPTFLFFDGFFTLPTYVETGYMLGLEVTSCFHLNSLNLFGLLG